MRSKIALVAIIALALMKCSISVAQTQNDGQPPYLNPALPVEERVRDLMSRLTPEEKVVFLVETNDPVPRLNIPEYYFGNEALHGVVRPGPFTVFPQAIALASTWDPELLHTVATAISDEARGKNNLMKGKIPDRYCGLLAFWSPTINMVRDPRWGRTPETYGEDPWLTGRMAVAFVSGLQGDDPKYIKVVSTPKHFAANNEEHNRFECNAKISEKALREYYLPGYRAAVTEANAQSVMGAYNAVNGIPCNANKKLLTDILRNEWGFDGYVVTDCGALSTMISAHKYAKNGKESAAFALNAGVDLECGGDQILKKYSLAAVKEGLTTQEALDQAVFRVLRARFRLGMFDPPEMVPYSKISPDVVGSKEHSELARKMAQESIVLLKNAAVDGKPLLPLDMNRLKSIAVVGPNAPICRFGDYSGSPVIKPVSPLDGITAKLGGRIKLNYVQWIPAPGANDYVALTGDNLVSTSGAKGLDARYFANKKFSGEPATSRADDRVEIDTLNKPPDPAIPYGSFSVKWTGKLKPSLTGKYLFRITAEGGARLSLDGKVLIDNPVKSSVSLSSGKAIDMWAYEKRTDVLYADAVLEAGRSYDMEVTHIHADGKALMKLEWIPPSPEKAKARAAELEVIKNSDVAVAVLGIGLDQEREGLDRTTMDLPEDQEEYIRQVIAANPRTTVVLISGSPLSINWIKDNVPAVLTAWYPGERGGDAIADILFGDYNPVGRLPVTFYKSVEELPPFDDYEVSRGRTYMYMKNEPLFPFGHGLSYTKFDYSSLNIDKKQPGPGDTIKVSLNVANTGGMDGDEVVQIYVRDVESTVKRPSKQLKGFKRIHLKTGEKKTVEIPIKVQDLAFWDENAGAFAVEPGEYEIMAGASSADIRLKDKIVVGK